MTSESCVKDHGGFSTITIEASPGASKTEISGTNPWRAAVKIRIAAQPKEGEANAELIRFLAETLSVPANEVEIIKGERSSLKVIRVHADADKVRSLLGVE